MHSHDGAHTHSAGAAEDRGARKRRLRIALGLAVACFTIEVVGGFVAGSLALLADAAHLLADVAALVLAYAAMTLADFVPTKRYTFGLYRAEILAAFVNAEALLAVTAFILFEAYQRMFSPPEVHTGLMAGFAAVGLAVNLAAASLLREDQQHSLNSRAAYLEVVSDALGSLGALLAAGVMRLTGWLWIDPLISAAIGCIVLPRALSLLRQSAHVLLEGSPHEVDSTEVRTQLLKLPGVIELHDLHFWTLTSGVHAASVHVRTADERGAPVVLRSVQQLLKERAGIDHSTIQVECDPDAHCATGDHA